MHRIYIFLLFFSLSINCEGQQQLPPGFGFYITSGAEDWEIELREKELSKYNYQELDSFSKWTYDLNTSSILLYTSRDSSVYYFNRAYSNQPFATCRVMSAFHSKYLKENITNKSTWYLWDLPDFDENSFINECDEILPKGEPLLARDTSEIERIIREQDQKYRYLDPVPWQIQSPLDSLNRVYIDSLYDIKGSLKDFTEGEIYQFSMVAHHSEDCDWVYKWTERLLDYHMSGYKGKMLLGALLQRMFDSKESNIRDGYCTGIDRQKRDYFIYMIKDKYPEFVESLNFGW